jgi:hypothetical protein
MIHVRDKPMQGLASGMRGKAREETKQGPHYIALRLSELGGLEPPG